MIIYGVGFFTTHENELKIITNHALYLMLRSNIVYRVPELKSRSNVVFLVVFKNLIDQKKIPFGQVNV